MKDSSDSTDSKIVIAPKELKELRRVYDKLCFYADKASLSDRIQRVRDEIVTLNGSTNEESDCLEQATLTSQVPLQTVTTVGSSVSRSDQTTVSSSSSKSSSPNDDGDVDDDDDEKSGRDDRVASLRAQLAKLEKSLRNIESRPADKQFVRAQDVSAALKRLGRKQVTKRQVLDMIWEVDENLDHVVDWSEFMLMFERNIRDTSGLEPADFFHMVQFMIYDSDDNGMVSIDETMNMLYARLGREKMEKVIGKLFGGEDGAPVREMGIQGGEINFTRYYEVVTREQERMFEESEMGRMLSEKKNGRTK